MNRERDGAECDMLRLLKLCGSSVHLLEARILPEEHGEHQLVHLSEQMAFTISISQVMHRC